MAKSNQAVATANAFNPAATEVPAFLRQTESRGNENVGGNLEIPRIKLLQKMNDEVDKMHSSYIEGAEPGMFVNVLNKQLFDEVFVISVHFKVEFVIWRKREHGGGKQGTFATREEANNWLATDGAGEAEKFDVSENHQHLLLMYDQETGTLSNTPAIMDFSGSKLRVSKNWNSKIVEKGGDRFSTIWKFKPVMQSNDKGTWVNISAEYVGYVANEADYQAAEMLYQSTQVQTVH